MVLLGVSISLLQKPRIPLNVVSPVAPSSCLQIVSPGTYEISPGSEDVGIGAGGGTPAPKHRAKALYACTLPSGTFCMHLLTPAQMLVLLMIPAKYRSRRMNS